MSERPNRPEPADLLAVVVFAAVLALAAFIWRHGPPGLLPIHLDIFGRVDGRGDRTFVAIFLACLSIGLGACYALIGAVTHGRSPDASRRRGLRTAKLLIVFIVAMVAGLTLALIYGPASTVQASGGRISAAILALIFLGIGAIIGKAGPNPFVGVRTYWTLKSRLAWDKSNRLMGRLFFWIGLAGLLASPWLDASLVTPALIVAILIAAAASVFESWRVWRTDPERNQS